MGCVASKSAPPPHAGNPTAGAHNQRLDSLPGESNDADELEKRPNAGGEANQDVSAKYTPRDGDKIGRIAQGALLSMAMEADTTDEVVTERPRAISFAAKHRNDVNEERINPIPDLSYSMREASEDHKQADDITLPTTGPSNHSGLSKNVVVVRPTVHNLQPGGLNLEFTDQHAGHVFVPLQPFGPRALPFGAIPQGPGGMPMVHPMTVTHGHPGVFQLTPLDPNAPIPAVGFGPPMGSATNIMGGRGRGRGLPTLVVGPATAVAPGGFRGPSGALGFPGGVPLGFGRGRGQPLQIVIPGQHGRPRDSGRRQQEIAPSIERPPSVPRDEKVSPENDDDDNDDLVDDDEEVEDWGLDVHADADAQISFSAPSGEAVQEQHANHSTKPLPHTSPDPKATATKPVDPSPKKKFRPAFELADDDIEAVNSLSDEDIDSDDDFGVDEAGEAADELHDWLDTTRDAGVKTSRNALSPPKTYPQHDNRPGTTSGASTPLNSPSKSSRGPPPASPINRQRHQVSTGSPHPPPPSQQASLRQLQVLAANGHTSPTRPAGPPPIGGSPVKPPSYRSNIVTNAAPPMLPQLNGAASPLAVPGDQTATGIRDTKVVKKKKAELPQTNLPHPAPKFGDWLNSRTMINNYIILESLGAGSYAEVKLCKEKVTGKLFAMKFINRDVMKKDKLGKQSKLDDIKREIAIMKKLNHPNVLRLYEVMDDPSMNKLFLVLEYMKHGDLIGHQKKKNPNGTNLHDRDLHCVTLQVILGLAYLHEQKIVHGDIKPQNLLVGDKDVVKIADFGISQSLYGSKQKLSDTAGTPAFMSPEMCSGQEYSGQLADIWAVGATIFMLKFGQPPFVAKSAMQMFERIQNDPLVFPGPIDPLLEDLLRGMLTKNPLKRTTLLQIMTHPWVTKEEHPSHFALKEKSPQITVTNEEVDNAIDARDKFAIIVNIRVQMMKRLQMARNEILKNKQFAGVDDSYTAPHQMLVSSIAQIAAHGDSGDLSSPTAEKSSDKAHIKSGTKLKVKSNKVFVDAAAQDTTHKHNADQNILSTEETHYRSQLFSRKKVSGVAGTNGASTATFPKLTDIEDHQPRDAASVAPGVDNVDETFFTDDEEDEDDEQAVSQSPQLLDELLLTTLKMPPLTKSTLPSDASTAVVAHSTAAALASLVSPAAHDAPDAQSFSAENPHLNISIAVASLQGRRNIQEDRWTVVPSIASDVSSRWSRSLFAGLYDGHGGEECANILQEQLHPWLLRAHDEYFASPEKLARCFLEFDAFLCDFLLQKGDLSGSTATCLFVDYANSDPARGVWNVLIGHVGDCRLVLTSRRGSGAAVRDLTSDHRLTLPAERDRILQLGGRVVNNRVNGVMAITRAFGDLEFKGRLRGHGSSAALLLPEAVQQSPFARDDERTPALLTAQPDVHVCRIDAMESEYLILACDGLWDVMGSDEAAEILSDRVHFHGNVALAAKELAQEGIRRFSNDNISVLVLQFPLVGREVRRCDCN